MDVQGVEDAVVAEVVLVTARMHARDVHPAHLTATTHAIRTAALPVNLHAHQGVLQHQESEGEMINAYREPASFSITLNTTEDCNLRCSYCYEVNKQKRALSLRDAKLFIDQVLTDNDPGNVLDDADPVFRNSYDNGLVVDFIGGDSLMDVDFLDNVISYTLFKLMTTDTENARKWRGKVHFSISTNGTLFSPKVRAFCEKYKEVLLIGVSLDGCPEIHDRNRLFSDGSGSMDRIILSWTWFQKTFPISASQTKATANRESIPYLYKSLRFLYEEMGITHINQNFIMEDMHLTVDDLRLLDEELSKCVDYVLEHRHELYWSMLGKDQFAYAHLSEGKDWEETGHCGSGAMPALSVDGNIYPCIRWLPHTQVDKAPFIVGTAKDGFTHKENYLKVRHGAYRANCTKDEKCRSCEYESACAYCIGGCYSEFGEFRRTTYSCEVVKLLVKWSRIYWDRYNELENLSKVDWLKKSKTTEFRKRE